MDSGISEKLQSVLQNPESLKAIMNVVSSLGDGNIKEKQPSETAIEQAVKVEDVENQNDGDKKPASLLQNSVNDDRIRLLLSIKPFLNNKKQQRVDSLVKALSAARLISAYSNTDLFSGFQIK